MKSRFEKVLSTLVIAAMLASSLMPAIVALADVTPLEIEVMLNPGESYVVEKTVTNPPIPPKLDFLLLEDETGSFFDDIALMKGTLPDHSDGLAAQIWDGLAAADVEFRGSVAGFADFAQDNWGGSWTYGNDWVYTLYRDMTSDKDEWLLGIGQLKTNSGMDTAEAQLAALVSGANGAAWDSNGDGDFVDPEDTPAGEKPQWMDEATKIIILVTDAPYHVYGDPEYPDDPNVDKKWPGPSYADAVAALNAEGIHVIILATNTWYYTSLAGDTGGATKQISSNSADIVDALMDALVEVRTDVWYEVDSQEGITVSLDPVMYEDVLGGSTLTFTETVTVEADAAPGDYTATVTFYANTWPHEGSEIGVETITVHVNGAPDCSEAYADPGVLWPPNHKMVAVHIAGVTDPDGDPVTLTVMGVWQDEPTEGLGDGDVSPDAVIYGDYIDLRAERSGTGDGRVYHILFTADDSKGGVCECEVTVAAPHSVKAAAVDGGALYDSTQP